MFGFNKRIISLAFILRSVSVRPTLPEGVLVGGDEVHDSSDARLRQQRLLVEVDDPGVILQDVPAGRKVMVMVMMVVMIMMMMMVMVVMMMMMMMMMMMVEMMMMMIMMMMMMAMMMIMMMVMMMMIMLMFMLGERYSSGFRQCTPTDFTNMT